MLLNLKFSSDIKLRLQVNRVSQKSVAYFFEGVIKAIYVKLFSETIQRRVPYGFSIQILPFKTLDYDGKLITYSTSGARHIWHQHSKSLQCFRLR
jgi:hypothetical protein